MTVLTLFSNFFKAYREVEKNAVGGKERTREEKKKIGGMGGRILRNSV